MANLEISKFNIGNITVTHSIILAPMAGITDRAFRQLAREIGQVSLMFTEMISIEGLKRNNPATTRLIGFDELERPLFCQLFGADPLTAAIAAAEAEAAGFDGIDLNAGCPIRKVNKNGSGSALLQDLPRLRNMLREIKQATSLPLTVKIRAGWDKNSINAPQVARLAQDEGVAAITVHGRTRSEKFSGTNDLDVIRSVKEAVSIPVIGSGDVTTEAGAKHMLEYTKCDGVMVGRAACGNFWVLNRMRHFLLTGEILPKPEISVVIKTIKKHVRLVVEFKGEHIGTKEIRKHVLWYTKGWPDSASLRNLINRTNTLSEIFRHLDDYHKKWKEHYGRESFSQAI